MSVSLYYIAVSLYRGWKMSVCLPVGTHLTPVSLYHSNAEIKAKRHFTGVAEF